MQELIVSQSTQDQEELENSPSAEGVPMCSAMACVLGRRNGVGFLLCATNYRQTVNLLESRKAN